MQTKKKETKKREEKFYDNRGTYYCGTLFRGRNG